MMFPPGGVLTQQQNAGFDKTNLIAWYDFESDLTDAHASNDLGDNPFGTGPQYVTGLNGNAARCYPSNHNAYVDPTYANLCGGPYDFTLGYWYKANTLVSAKYPLEQESTFYNYVESAFTLTFYTRTATLQKKVTATNFGALSTGTWYFILCYYDHSATTSYISINNGTPNSLNMGAAQRSGSGLGLKIGGSFGSSASDVDGVFDSLFFFKRLLTADEKTWLFNSGSGRIYADL